MNQLLKQLLAADRKRQLEAKGKLLSDRFKTGTNTPAEAHMDFLKFAEQYIGRMDENTGEFVAVKFSEVDRYLFERLEQAQENGMHLMYPTTSRQGRQPKLPSVGDGEEVHYLNTPNFGPIGERRLSIPTGIGGKQVRITLEEKFYPSIVYADGLHCRRSEVHFVKWAKHQNDPNGPEQVVLSFPNPSGKRIECYFSESPELWNLFPEIAKQLGKA